MENTVKNRWVRPVLWIMIAAGIAVRIQTAAHYNPMMHLWSDPERHWRWATNPLNTEVMSAIDPLMYQVWLSAIAKITGGISSAIAVYAGLLSILTPWVWYRFLRELPINKNLALAGWAILNGLPSWIGIYSYFMIETLLIPLLGLSLWFTWRSLRKGTVESFAWSTIFWAMTLLTKKVVLPLVLLSELWLIPRQTHRWSSLTYGFLIWACFLLPSAYRAHRIMGVWAPLGYSRLTEIYAESGKREITVQLNDYGRRIGEYRFLSPAALSHPFSPLSNWGTARDGMCSVTVDISKGSKDWDQALRNYKPSWSLALRDQIENCVFTLWDASWPDNNPAHFWENLSDLMRWVWAPLLCIVMGGNLWRWRNQNQLSLLAWMNLVIWILMCTVPLGVAEGRYRKPFEGLLIANALWLIAGKIEELR